MGWEDAGCFVISDVDSMSEVLAELLSEGREWRWGFG